MSRKRFICTICESTWDEFLECCMVCNNWGTFIPNMSKQVLPRPEKSFVKTAAELHEIEDNTVYWSDLCREILGGDPEDDPFIMTMYGLPGSGKSTLSLRLAGSLKVESLYVAAEEGGTSTMRKKLKLLDIKSDKLYITDEIDLGRIVNLAKQVFAQWVFIDSLHVANMLAEDLDALKSHGFNVVVVLHSTKDGMYKGNTAIGHLCDVEVQCHKMNYRVPIKSRFGIPREDWTPILPQEERADNEDHRGGGSGDDETYDWDSIWEEIDE